MSTQRSQKSVMAIVQCVSSGCDGDGGGDGDGMKCTLRTPSSLARALVLYNTFGLEKR